MGPLDVELPSCGKKGLGTRLEVSATIFTKVSTGAAEGIFKCVWGGG